MSARMNRTAFLVVCGMVVWGPRAWSQDSAETQPASSGAVEAQAVAPYWVRVTGDDVYLRSRADGNSQPVTKVDRDTALRGFGSQFGWHRVKPTGDVFCYVHSDYIERRGDDEGVVSVSSGKLRARVGSTLRDLDPWKSEVQTLLERGEVVKIRGAQGDWLKIAAPDDVFVFITDEYVEKIEEDVARRLLAARGGEAEAAATQPASEDAVAAQAGATSEGDDEDHGTPSPRRVDLGGPWGRKLMKVERDIQLEAAKELGSREWKPLIDRLEPIAMQRDEPSVARVAERWAAQLNAYAASEKVLRMTRRLSEQEERDRRRYQRELERIRQARESASTRTAYDARGELLRSYVTGGATRFQLRSPLTQRVVAYAEFPAGGKLDAKDYVGKYVGVSGQRRRASETLGVDVIMVEKIVILERPTLKKQTEKPGGDD